MSYTTEEEAIVTRILETKNFYDILQVPNDATIDDIKAAYKKLAIQVHPDKNNFPKAKEAFIVVRKATAVLLNKNTRQEYDAHLRSPTKFAADRFNLSDDAIYDILVSAGIAIVSLGLVWALYKWFSSPKEEIIEEKLKKKQKRSKRN